MTTLGSLFERPVQTWGLRGSPHVWAAMGEALAQTPLPGNRFDTRLLLERAFRDVTGFELPNGPGFDEALPVPQFAIGSGMSDGMISPRWWRETALEILIDRAAEAAGWHSPPVIPPAAGAWSAPTGPDSARFRFSARREDVDRALVHRWLSEHAYWALGRTRERNDRAMDGSRVFAVLDEHGHQVAYARVVTDGVEFAWLCDVFVDERVRGRGVGQQLIRGVIDALAPLELRRMLLATRDAHGLYGRFGFTPLDEPERWMLLPHPGTAPATS